MLFVIVALYGYFHYDSFTSRSKVDPTVVKTATKNVLMRIHNDSIRVHSFKLIENEGKLDSIDSLFIRSELKQLKGEVNDLIKWSKADTILANQITRGLEDLDLAISNHNKEDIQMVLNASKIRIKEIPQLLPSYFWKSVPGRYFEILFWAFLATVLRLIGNTGYYLTRNCFYRDSIWNKIPLLFTIPLIALIITFIISYFKISIFLGNANLTVDLSNPLLSIIVAFLIGLAPWDAWEFMYGLAEKLFGGLIGWANPKGNNKENEKEKDAPSNESASDATRSVPPSPPPPAEGSSEESTDASAKPNDTTSGQSTTGETVDGEIEKPTTADASDSTKEENSGNEDAANV